MDIYLEIYTFWKLHPQYWISIQNKDKADKHIVDEFYKKTEKIDTLITFNNISKHQFIGYIIRCDQFQRHFNRYYNLGEYNISILRDDAINKLDEKDENFFACLDSDELLFCMMPYKHRCKYLKCLDICEKWCDYNNQILKDCPIISRFYNDTYEKYYTYETIKTGIIKNHIINSYHSEKICDYYPELYRSLNWINTVKDNNISNPLKQWFNNIKKYLNNQTLIVSLSGGVDSMIILMLLKNLGANVKAVHIIYGNREVSNEEYSFISTYCNKLDVPLYAYRIKLLKRDIIERSFYEDMTRNIRFNVYKSIDSLNPIVILGHIKNDVIENIWTNISKCQHINNLGKMLTSEIQNGVQLERPFLNIDKSEIYNLSKMYGVPYLKNTTPSWSNRGKFREHFYSAIYEQFGKSIDSKLIMFADILKKQNDILERAIYAPIFESFKDNRIDITIGYNSKLDLSGWNYIIEKLCHTYIQIPKPSIRSIEQFINRLYQIDNNIKLRFQMKRNYQFLVYYIENRIYLDVILSINGS